jgi:toluene monooxygenase system protein A
MNTKRNLSKKLPDHDWFHLTKDLDWQYSYVQEDEVFPVEIAGEPWREQSFWQAWDEPFKFTYPNYVQNQAKKEESVLAVQDLLGGLEQFKKLPTCWLNALKLHFAVLPLAEFAATIGNLRMSRFGRSTAWRNVALFGAMDEFRHTSIPLLLINDLVGWDKQFDWTHKFYHSKNWVSIAARHFFDELLIASNPIEFAIATNFVFETGFTNLQFVALSSIAHQTGDYMFEKMVKSIQTDEARHAQMGMATLELIVKEDREYCQRLVDKWFWRSWRLFSIVTGFMMDYLTPVEHRKYSFKEFIQEWVLDQFVSSLTKLGLKKPWYWDQFLDSIEIYHHSVYVSAYTYRATVWFNMLLPSNEERAWLAEKYPKYWQQIEAVWRQVENKWENSDPNVEFAVHGTSIVGFCNLCQIILSGGTPQKNSAVSLSIGDKNYIFCSEPCRQIFLNELDRYQNHDDLVKRVLNNQAPGNLMAMLTQYFGLDYESWGKDLKQGDYPWLNRIDQSKKMEEQNNKITNPNER